MKKGITPIVATVILIMIAIVIASAFFYWFFAIQNTGQEATGSNLQVAQKLFVTRGQGLIDSYYTTTEETSYNDYADFKVNYCNNGDGTIDFTSQKGLHLKDKKEGKIICAESVFDGNCVTDTKYIVAGLSYGG